MAAPGHDWRGPFRVKRSHALQVWYIVNRHGDVERLGFTERATADAACDVMNRAGPEPPEGAGPAGN